jgi:hypothetical protein
MLVLRGPGPGHTPVLRVLALRTVVLVLLPRTKSVFGVFELHLLRNA